MLRYLAFPAIAAAIAAAIVSLPFLVPMPFLGEIRPVAAVLAGAIIFFFVLALANHVTATRLANRLRSRLSGLDDFDADLRRRIGKLETAITQLELAEERRGGASDNQESGVDIVSADRDADTNVVRFDAHQRHEGQMPTARPAGARLADALEHDTIQAWFQPIVTLPGRKTRFLEASPHLTVKTGAEAETGRRIEPGYSNAPEIDRRMLLQSLTLMRELDRAEKSLDVVWTIHAPLLADSSAYSAVERILETNSVFAQQLVVRIEYRDHAGLDKHQIQRLHHIRELGFKLALGQCPVPHHDVEAIKSGLFAMLFMDAGKLIASWLNADAPKSTPYDSGTGDAEIIAFGVSTEEQAMALIDLDILLAQGDFFSQPRPPRRSSQIRELVEN